MRYNTRIIDLLKDVFVTLRVKRTKRTSATSFEH